MIPKSLHTVTALVAVARLIREMDPAVPSSMDAVIQARAALGYADSPDVYGLCALAVAKLAKSTGGK